MELYQHYQKVSLELRKSNDRLRAELQLRHVNYHIFQNIPGEFLDSAILLSRLACIRCPLSASLNSIMPFDALRSRVWYFNVYHVFQTIVVSSHTVMKLTVFTFAH